ncbi:hypothetical protein [uncultured Sphingomonas sp.]
MFRRILYGIAFIGAGLPLKPASIGAQMRPGSGPIETVETPLACQLLAGAATSAPTGAAPGSIQQIVARSPDITREGMLVRAFVHMRNGQVVTVNLSTPPKLWAGQWVRVGEVTGGQSCSATLFTRSQRGSPRMQP